MGTNWRLWLRAASQGTTYFGLAMIALIWLSVHFHLAVERESTQQAAVQNSSNLARAFEEHLIRSLTEIDKALVFLRENYLKDPARFDMSIVGCNRTGFLGDPTLTDRHHRSGRISYEFPAGRCRAGQFI